MTDAAIVEAWERRKAAYDVYNALPFADERRGQVITVGGAVSGLVHSAPVIEVQKSGQVVLGRCSSSGP